MNHPNMLALAGLGAMSAGQVPYATAAGVMGTIATSSFMRGIMNDAAASNVRTSLGLVIGTDVQAYDASLLSFAALATAADKLPYTTGADTWAETAITAAGRAILDDADAAAQATTLGLGTGSAVTHASLTLTGALSVAGAVSFTGTPVLVDAEHVDLRSNYLQLNLDYVTAVAQTAGFVANYLPTATATTVNGNYTAGVDGVSDPTVVTTGSATFAVTDLVMISGSTNNDGLYEVQGHTGTTLALKSTSNGVTNRVELFTLDQLVAGASDGAAITKVTVSALRCGTDGAWETGSGSQTGITYSDLSSITAAVAIALGGSATPVEGAAGTYAKSNHDHGYSPLTDGNPWGSITASWDVYARAMKQRGITAPKTGNYTILATEGHIGGDASGGAFNLTLPDLTANKGLWIPISNIGASGNVTLLRAGSDTIGQTTSLVLTPSTNLWVFAPHVGTDWLIF